MNTNRLVLISALSVLGLALSACSDDTPSGGSAECSDTKACSADNVCDDGKCRVPLICDEIECADHQICKGAQPGVDAACLAECENDWAWDSANAICTTGSCEVLNCEGLEHRECALDPEAQCGVCLVGWVDEEGTCREAILCDAITCTGGLVCVEAAANEDAYCASGCPADSIDSGGSCYPCPACDDASKGEDGAYLEKLSLENKCICQTKTGFYWEEGGFPGVKPCDADDDGWVRESAKKALSAPADSAVLINARCDVHQTDTIVLHNDVGQTYPVDLGDTVSLFETDRNDDAVLLNRAIGDGKLPAYGEDGRYLDVKELNSLTKACTDDLADYNENGLGDLTEYHTTPDVSVVKPTFKPFVDFTYFIELSRSWYEAPADGATLGTYHIAEKSRKIDANTGLGMAVKYDAGEPGNDHWSECTIWQDSDYLSRKDAGEELTGMDFARFDADGENWSGMVLHSMYKCIEIVASTPNDLHQHTRDEIIGGKLTFNRCNATSDVAPVPSTQNPTNPKDVVLSCEASGEGNLGPGQVGFAAVQYTDYDSDYKRGCVNECNEFPDYCPGYNSDTTLNTSMCEGNAANFGKIYCGCGYNYGGANCEIGCPGSPDNPDNPAVRNELFYDAAFKDITTEDGFWMCLRPGAASSVPEGLSGTDSETGGTYNLKGNIPVDPPIDGNMLCETPGDCSVGFTIR
ncbi:hypothetical protein KAI87_02375 [Myxococcota bacterium]|nr:hypothetical protein [Myxococcota bacterium]